MAPCGHISTVGATNCLCGSRIEPLRERVRTKARNIALLFAALGICLFLGGVFNLVRPLRLSVRDAPTDCAQRPNDCRAFSGYIIGTTYCGSAILGSTPVFKSDPLVDQTVAESHGLRYTVPTDLGWQCTAARERTGVSSVLLLIGGLVNVLGAWIFWRRESSGLRA